MNVPLHLVIAFAASSGAAWAPTMASLPPGSLPHLRQLLRGMKRTHTISGDAHSLSPPHERLLADGCGLTAPAQPGDGLIPWAGLEAEKTGAMPGKAWAFITPCHWAMGREHATLTDPSGLALTENEAHTLVGAMQPYFITEGITLHETTPGRWLADGEVFRTLPTASLDRVLGRNVDAWLPDTTTAPSLRRLHNEMQMLLYTHPVNEARSANRQRTINSFWISGTGAVTQPAPASTAHITAPRTLAQAVFADDWEAYAAAWTALDGAEIAQWLARQDAGETVRISLCGESHAQTFESARTGWLSRFSSYVNPPPLVHLLEQL